MHVKVALLQQIAIKLPQCPDAFPIASKGEEEHFVGNRLQRIRYPPLQLAICYKRNMPTALLHQHAHGKQALIVPTTELNYQETLHKKLSAILIIIFEAKSTKK